MGDDSEVLPPKSVYEQSYDLLKGKVQAAVTKSWLEENWMLLALLYVVFKDEL